MIFRLRRSDIVASDSDMKAYGFRDILFAIKARNAHIVSARISLGESRISLQSNRTRRRRIKLRNFLMRSWATGFFFSCFLLLPDPKVWEKEKRDGAKERAQEAL